MAELISTITNALFIIAGLFILKRSLYVGLVTVLLGIASAGWHWTMQPFWHTFDFAMMYFMLLSLVDYSTGSEYTKTAFLTGLGLIGLHFLLPSHGIICAIALGLLLALVRNYSPGRIFIIVACFLLWISTNIPYLHQWSVPFWKLDVLHGFSHAFAALGILMTVRYKPTTFSELATAFKSYHLTSLKVNSRMEYERIIDFELTPVLGKLPVEGICRKDISRLMDNIVNNRDGKKLADKVHLQLNQIFEFAERRGIQHNLIAGTYVHAGEKKR